MFDWSAPAGTKVVSERFWVYWAITVPATLVVMLFFWVFVIVHLRNDEGARGSPTATVAHTADWRLPITPFQNLKRRATERRMDAQSKKEMA